MPAIAGPGSGMNEREQGPDDGLGAPHWRAAHQWSTPGAGVALGWAS